MSWKWQGWRSAVLGGHGRMLRYRAAKRTPAARRGAAQELDGEGRVTVTDHGAFVLFNIYGRVVTLPKEKDWKGEPGLERGTRGRL